MSVAVVLPAWNEEEAVEGVVRGFREHADRVVVVDNGSDDRTAQAASGAGAEVVLEPRRGYGRACLAGVEHLRASPPDVVAFADCDATLDPADLPRLVRALAEADLALGRRARLERGALPAHQRLGNDIACLGLRAYGLRVRDVPPFRALRWSAIVRLALREPTYGLPLETLAIAARLGLRVEEVDTSYRRRVGESKVTGTLAGSAKAALVTGSLLVRLRFRRLPS